MICRRMSHIENMITQGQNYTVTGIGDSITYGLDHCTKEETVYACLARLFAERFPQNKVVRYDGVMVGGALPLDGYSGPEVVNDAEGTEICVVKSGVGGDTVRRAINRKNDFSGEFIKGKKTDLYLIMFGINDALSDPLKHIEPDGYYSDLCELYDLLKYETPEAEIVFMTPTYNDLGNKNESVLAPYVEKMRVLAAEKNCQLIDTHKLWMDHLIVDSENYGQRDWLSGKKGDSCHMSPLGSLITAKFIFSQLDN